MYYGPVSSPVLRESGEPLLVLLAVWRVGGGRLFGGRVSGPGHRPTVDSVVVVLHALDLLDRAVGGRGGAVAGGARDPADDVGDEVAARARARPRRPRGARAGRAVHVAVGAHHGRLVAGAAVPGDQ